MLNEIKFAAAASPLFRSCEEEDPDWGNPMLSVALKHAALLYFCGLAPARVETGWDVSGEPSHAASVLPAGRARCRLKGIATYWNHGRRYHLSAAAQSPAPSSLPPMCRPGCER